jgi:hypothetical protein
MRATTLATTVLVAAVGFPVAGPAAAADARVTKGCGGRVYAGPSGGEGEGSGGSSVWGSPGYQKRYTWDVEGDFGKVNVSVRGFDPETNAETWYYAGLWDAGSRGHTTVPWGNNAATPKIRVKTPPGPFPGLFVSFDC